MSDKKWLQRRKLRAMNGGTGHRSSEVTLPREMVEHLGAKHGDELTFEPATKDAEYVVILRRQSA